jgi:hypothetical protein
MAANWSQQGCLRINKEQGLVEKLELQLNKEYPFIKDGHRLYMLDTPIELVSEDWQALARVLIVEITVGRNVTKGFYKVLKIYSDEETKVVSGTFIPYTNLR